MSMTQKIFARAETELVEHLDNEARRLSEKSGVKVNRSDVVRKVLIADMHRKQSLRQRNAA